ncbi:hypothetical protein ACOMHN_016317 [Nucella lapillus]
MDTHRNRRSGAPSVVHGSPFCASPPSLSSTTDVKALLMASGDKQPVRCQTGASPAVSVGDTHVGCGYRPVAADAAAAAAE